MGRFIGLSKNKGSGHQLEDPSTLNSGLVLTSNGTAFILAGGASLDRDPLPDYINGNQTINTTLTVTGAFGDSVYTFAWRNGAQYGLAISSAGVLTGSASSMITKTVLELDITDTKYNKVYEVDVVINVSTVNSFPDISTDNSAITLLDPITEYQFTNTGTATEWSITSFGNLPAGTTISNTGLMDFPNSKAGDNTNTTYSFTLGVRNDDFDAGDYRTTAFSKSFDFQTIQGQQQYEGAYGQNGGQCSYTWVAPAGVTSVNVLAIGGGGGGCYQWAVCGGHGGANVWANNIPVTPGSSYCVQVGRGGCWSGTTGGHSCWPGMTACGGCCGCYGGCYNHSSTGGTQCCAGYGMPTYNTTAGGGGGAGGYGGGQNASTISSGYRGCCGGGGSGASNHSSTHGTGGGGGTGSCGMCCYSTGGPYGESCGKCAWANTGHSTSGGSGQGGSGGNCGKPGEPYSNGSGNGYACGGLFGGGGGGGGTSQGGGWGGPGVVRIIWGTGRSWPCTNTHNL